MTGSCANATLEEAQTPRSQPLAISLVNEVNLWKYRAENALEKLFASEKSEQEAKTREHELRARCETAEHRVKALLTTLEEEPQEQKLAQFRLKENTEASQKKLADLEERFKQERAKAAALEGQKKVLVCLVQLKNKQIGKQAEERTKLDEDVRAMTAEMTKLNDKIERKTREVADMREDFNVQLNYQKEQYDQEYDMLSEDLRRKDEEIADLHASLETQARELCLHYETRVDQLKKEKDEDIAKKMSKVDDLRASYDIEINILRERNNSFKLQYDRLEKSKNEEVANKTSEIASVRASYDTEVNDLREHCRHLCLQVEALENQVSAVLEGKGVSASRDEDLDDDNVVAEDDFGSGPALDSDNGDAGDSELDSEDWEDAKDNQEVDVDMDEDNTQPSGSSSEEEWQVVNDEEEDLVDPSD